MVKSKLHSRLESEIGMAKEKVKGTKAVNGQGRVRFTS